MHPSTFSQIHADKIDLLASMIPEYHKHLNEVRFFYTRLQSLDEIFNHSGKTEYDSTVRELKEHLDLNGFLTICSLDLLVTCQNLLRSKEFWEEVYYLRHGYLTIYEALKTYQYHNTRINNLIETKYLLLNTSFKELGESIREYKKDYEYNKTIDKIRNQTTAHIQFNFLEYFDIISGFDIEKATWSIIDFLNILNKMQSLSSALVHESDKFLKENATHFDQYLQNFMNNIAKQFAELNKTITFD